MLVSRLIRLLRKYDDRLGNAGIPAVKMNTSRSPSSSPMRLGHCRWMAQEMVQKLHEELEEYELQHAVEKALRWLGFIQGVFWIEGYYTVDEMKDHSR